MLRSTFGLASAVYSAILFGAQDEHLGCQTLTPAPASLGAVPLPQAGEAKRLCAEQDVVSAFAGEQNQAQRAGEGPIDPLG